MEAEAEVRVLVSFETRYPAHVSYHTQIARFFCARVTVIIVYSQAGRRLLKTCLISTLAASVNPSSVRVYRIEAYPSTVDIPIPLCLHFSRVEFRIQTREKGYVPRI